jgi:peptidoglycan/LPS O-acetylase OafA/YrhL
MAYMQHVPGTMTMYTGHFWSLAVEEQFYLIWPIVVAGLMALSFRRRWLVGLTIAGILAPPMIRFLLVRGCTFPLTDPNLSFRVYMGTDARGDGLSVGCLLGLVAMWRSGPRELWTRRGLQVAGLLAAAVFAWHLFTVSPTDHAYLYHGGYSIVEICNALLLASLIWSPPPLLAEALQARPLRWLGRISYGTYLWHWPIAWFLRTRLASEHPRITTVLIVICGVAAGALSYYVIEQPFLRLKERLGRRKSGPTQIPLDHRPADRALAA